MLAGAASLWGVYPHPFSFSLYGDGSCLRDMVWVGAPSFIFRNRKALLMTETDLRLIAASAMIGLSSRVHA
jgi:hypothetical protein